jgi:hypothetical protein
MGTNGTSALKYPTKCRLLTPEGLPCGKTIINHALNVEIIGQAGMREKIFFDTLRQHIERKHPEAWKQIELTQQLFAGFLLIGQFATKDPGLVKTIYEFGAQLRRLVSLPPIPDSDIQKAAELLREDPTPEKFLNFARNLQGYYSGTVIPTAPPAEKPLITQ